MWSGGRLDFPANNIVAKSKIDKDLIKSADWQASKLSDMSAGQRIIELIWSEKKTGAVRNIVDDPDNTVFVAMPSSTGKNTLPICLAARLAQETGATYEIGNHHFFSLHHKEIKQLSRIKRIFFERQYEMVDGKAFFEKFAGKQVIVIEDIFTTGGSVKYFLNALAEKGVKATAVVALMGDRRLNIDDKYLERLCASFEKAGINCDATKIAKTVTRTEAGYIMMAANGARSENAKKRLTENLQRLLDRGTHKDLERYRYATGHERTERGHKDHEGVSERIQSWAFRGASRVGASAETYEIKVRLETGSRRTYTKDVQIRAGLNKESRRRHLTIAAKQYVCELGHCERAMTVEVSQKEKDSVAKSLTQNVQFKER